MSTDAMPAVQAPVGQEVSIEFLGPEADWPMARYFFGWPFRCTVEATAWPLLKVSPELKQHAEQVAWINVATIKAIR